MTKSSSTKQYSRYFTETPSEVDNPLGPLSNLLGNWSAVGTGWNMIALPFKDAPNGFSPFRILMNQYDETLNFAFVDDNVANRGVAVDQRIATLDYQQKISQTIAEDFPPSSEAGDPGLPIHHEPGLWIHVKDEQTNGIDIARLASIPHGNSVLCLGESSVHEGMPDIPPINALPHGRFEDMSTPGYDIEDDDYLRPYKHFVDNPFMGSVPGNIGFPGFNPRDMTEILRFANQGVNITRTTQLTVDSKREDAGVNNMPFVTKEAEAMSMRSTFWIQEVGGDDYNEPAKLRLQYMQVVMLNFFKREDELPGRAEWPHVSICTLEKEV